jgi:rubrerythrin
MINLSDDWSDDEFALIPEKRIEQIGEALNEKNQLTIDHFYNLVDEVKTAVYRCTKCGRFHVEENGRFFSYLRE